VRFIYSVSVGDDQSGFLDEVETPLGHAFGFPTRRLARAARPQGAFDVQRGQYSADLILQGLCARMPGDALRLLAVTELDLFAPALSYVFGYARFAGPAAIVSIARLRQEAYRLPPDRQLLTARLIKESLHEMAHTFGLTHCSDEACPMSLSTVILEVDAKGSQFCGGCTALLEEHLRSCRSSAETPGRL
jgi:archaemetzincin